MPVPDDPSAPAREPAGVERESTEREGVERVGVERVGVERKGTERERSGRPERADAARNRRAILRAAEELLDAHGAEHVSVDRVAAVAGVGKGTVFRRFGSRGGLLQELLAERAARLGEAIAGGPPPLGPGAEPGPRLLAFLGELAELAVRNVALMTAHDRTCAADKYTDPTYLRWHAHVSALLAEARPGAEPGAGFLAHTLLGCFDGDLVRHLSRPGDPELLSRSVRAMAGSLLGPTAGDHHTLTIEGSDA